jgi:hypothetical protein
MRVLFFALYSTSTSMFLFHIYLPSNYKAEIQQVRRKWSVGPATLQGMNLFSLNSIHIKAWLILKSKAELKEMDMKISLKRSQRIRELVSGFCLGKT